MTIKQIEELIKFVSKSGVNEVSLETKEIKITIKTGAKAEPTVAVSHQPIAYASAPATPAPIAAPAAVEKPKPVELPTSLTVKSPMIGTFYRSSSPDKPALVSIGDEVKVGQVLCIIEAMKLFNEIESDVAGRVVKVLADNATPVEYDQPLFLVEPIK